MGRPWAPRPREVPGTFAMVLACSLAFLLTFVWTVVVSPDPVSAAVQSLWQLESPLVLVDLGALVAVRVWIDQQWWRVLSSALLHGSWLHFLLNMSALWVLGAWNERAFGWKRVLALFWLTSTVGCLASLSVAEADIVVGASAGIFGLGGSLVMARRFGTVEIQKRIAPIRHRRLAIALVGWILVGFGINALESLLMIAQAGHIGGFLSGLVLGWGFSRDKSLKLHRIIAMGAVCASIALGVFCARQPIWKAEFHAWSGAEQIRRGDVESGVIALERGLELAPEDHGLKNNIAWQLVETGRELPRAERLVREALAVEPASPSYLDTLGWIQCKRGDVQGGLATLAIAAEAADGDPAEQLDHAARCESVAPR